MAIKNGSIVSVSSSIFVLLVALMAMLVAAPVKANESQQVMQGFVNKEHVVSEHVLIETKQKHQILFFIGITLLVLILATAWFGIAMAVFGKQVFVPHMICAGGTVFLAMAHAVTAIVWFFPFN
jgi:hypothetical protein